MNEEPKTTSSCQTSRLRKQLIWLAVSVLVFGAVTVRIVVKQGKLEKRIEAVEGMFAK